MTTKEFGHYTSQAGLVGIVDNRKLWATNINFLNDAHEFQHAIDLIKNLLKISGKNFKPNSTLYPTYRLFIEKLEAELVKLESSASERIFTISFSAKTDLLSQWRGYCPANNGFCLVFDLFAIFNLIKLRYQNIQFKDCVYQNADKYGKLKTTLNEHWHQYCAETSSAKKTKILNNLSREIMLLASHFKHPSFSEEVERRFIIILDDSQSEKIKFREGKFSLIPYLELDFSLESMLKIYLGPTANPLLANRAAQMFLKDKFKGAKPPPMRISKTPYRPW